MLWFVWAILLLLQNAAFVLNSRARNGKSYWYHMCTANFSNGIWFISNLLLVDQFINILKTGSWENAIPVWIFYTFFTSLGALSSHWLAMNVIEKKFKERI